MRFVLAMARRETRAAWKRLLFFFVCIAVGVGAIVALRSVIQSARLVLTREARTLLAADVMVSTNRPWPVELRQKVDARIARAPVLRRTESIETATMVRPEDPAKAVAKMVELRAVQRDFPLHGSITLHGGQPYSYALLENRGMKVSNMKLENVVNPPRIPTNTNVRHSLDMCNLPVATSAPSRPIVQAPTMFTAPVA
jgi:putative ABC transport system permease protein